MEYMMMNKTYNSVEFLRMLRERGIAPIINAWKMRCAEWVSSRLAIQRWNCVSAALVVINELALSRSQEDRENLVRSQGKIKKLIPIETPRKSYLGQKANVSVFFFAILTLFRILDFRRSLTKLFCFVTAW